MQSLGPEIFRKKKRRNISKRKLFEWKTSVQIQTNSRNSA